MLIETILAAFEMDEILYELREHRAGLNAGRWDYIFSCIKKFKNDKNFCLADRAQGHDDVAVHARLRAAAAEDLPQARRAGDRRHGGADPDQERSGEEREGDGRHPHRQGARRHRRLRRRLGRAPGPGADRDGGVRQGAGRQAEPVRQAARGRQRQRPPTCSTSSPRRRSPKPACATTSTSASTTSAPGWPATAACRSTT